jgi:hypothetical protein
MGTPKGIIDIPNFEDLDKWSPNGY